MGFKGRMFTCAALGAALAFAGCGGDDEAEQGGSSGANSQGVQEAEAFVGKWSKTPTTIALDKPLAKAPPEGKTISHIRCPIEGCEAIYTGLEEASKVLGWNVEPFNMDNTPEGVNQAFQSALERKPDGIVISGIPAQVYQQHLDEAKAAGIPVVSLSTVDEATGMDGNGLIATINQAKQTQRFGELVGNWIAADDDGKGKDVAVFSVANFPTLTPFAETVKRVVGERCGDCEVAINNVQVTDVGRRMPSQVVSAIQQNPDIKYVALAFGQMSTGVRPALERRRLQGHQARRRGLVRGQPRGSPQWARSRCGPASRARFRAGTPWTRSRASSTTRTVTPTDDVVMPTQILTKQNVGTDKWFLGPKDSQQQFKDLWKVDG